MKKQVPIIMIGPDINGLGGISRVVRIFRDSGLFDELCIRYVSSTTDMDVNRLFFLLRGIISFLTKIVQPGSVVYIHTSSYKSFYRKSVFICLAILFNNKCVLHIHPSHFYEFLVSLKGIRRKFVHYLIRRMKIIIVLTDAMKERMNSLFPASDIQVLRNPVPFKKMENRNNIRRSANRFLYLGWYIREKGVYELVDAIEMLVSRGLDIHLEYFGTKQIDALRKYVEIKKLEKRIMVNGWIDDIEKIDKLYQCTALILPSHSEGIPNVILEAMSTKTPIISTKVGGLKEVLKDRKNALVVNVNDPSDLSEKISFCLHEKELSKKMADYAYKEAKTKYEINIIKNRFKQIIEPITQL
ncbi:MAG: glycosyltransferase family 4 protein [Desulfobacula sp.]|jgi:glycosyltransferase involved in cell wall biosynthesis|uniref:glycosyltransferase family 4 protein n=1 Tax=Desulfobacula sp. TaxID=2593537 RepID=UPI001D53AAB4|nr:glycosyltransferase family 4 protein [Desulfobacula sp.]MBT3487423.1 glycosyltransferase family 4 protein [Desulfobacula sp.]MBT3806951.1 glycosyltransferase family 4 protein [Desulfobacula sp.]MBT4026578.1 glycosyltransferase family 4 protein [Desulfobacula sp.]MBT4201020.1 glycosyltransferase family 4 protein [Desulfobacula sp.]